MRLSALSRLLLTGYLCSPFSAELAQATIRVSGVLCVESGSCLVSSPDGRLLQLSNLGSTGLDGVDVTLSHMESHVVHSSSTWSSVDDGAVLSYSWGVSQTGTLSGSSGSGLLSLQRVGGDVVILLDMDGLTDATTVRCLLYLAGGLVGDVVLPASNTIQLTSPPGSSVIPEVSFELDPARDLVFSSVRVSGSLVVVAGGLSVVADRVVCVGDLDRDGELDVCTARFAIPPSSSLSSLELDSQSTGRFGHSLAVADLNLDGDPDGLHIAISTLPTHGALYVTSSLSSMVFPPSSGGGGSGGSSALSLTPSTSLVVYSPGAMLHFSRLSPFVLDPSTDDGASLLYRLSGSGTCSPTGEVASSRLLVFGGALSLESDFSGMCADAESVIVLRRGLEVARFAVTLGGALSVTSPPGGSPITPVCSQGKSTQVTRSNISNNLTGSIGEDGTVGSGQMPASPPQFSSLVGPDGVTLQFSFLGDRVFCFGGTCATGDEVLVKGVCTSGACSPVTLSSSSLELHRASSGSGGGSLYLTGASPTGEDLVTAYVPATVAISSHTPVVQVPVMFDRVDATAARATSVTFSLSSNLVLASSVVESSYFSSLGTTQMFVVDNGGGSYTVDLALLGPGCGPTGSGTLFVLSLAAAPGAPDGMGFVSVDQCRAVDCTGGPLPAGPGGQSQIVLDRTPPSSVSVFSVTQQLSGNDSDGSTKLSLSFSTPGAGDLVEVYRASFGNSPEYDDPPNPGSVPPMPSYPPSGRWTPVSLTCPSSAVGALSECTDEPSSRDVYYFVIQLRDAYGNAALSSSMSSGTLNYHLGDVSNGLVECTGDNQVTTADVSALGAHYGATVPNGSSFSCLDVGPTLSGRVDGRPMTDNRVAFDDLVLFAINFASVSAPAASARPAAAPANLLRVSVPQLPRVGSTFDAVVEMEGAGDVQALSTQLGWDASVVEPVAVSKGDLLTAQGREGVVFSSAPGNVDAALLGAGAGVSGRGALARVTFRVKTAGDPAIRVAGVTARDVRNSEVAISGAAGVGGGSPGTALRLAFPNPFERSTTVVLSLGTAGQAQVGVFDVAGRHVRTLHAGVMSAGQHSIVWDGRDDSGQRLEAGVYMLRFTAVGRSETRALRLVR